jgi:hypothetical protein
MAPDRRCHNSVPDSLLENLKKLNMDDKPIAPKKMQRSEPSFEIDHDFDNLSVQRPPRPSYEHHSSTVDFLASMHGATPSAEVTKLKPSRTSLHVLATSAAATDGCASPYIASSVAATNHSIACPSNSVLT